MVAVGLAFLALGRRSEIARGQDGAPYYQLGAVGGAAYVAALVFLRFRR